MGGSGAALSVLGLYSLTTWLPMMMLGLAVGRLGVDRKRVQLTMIGVGAACMTCALGIAALATAFLGPIGSGATPLGGSASSWSSAEGSNVTSTVDTVNDSGDWLGTLCAKGPAEREQALKTSSPGGGDALGSVEPGVTDGWAPTLENFPPEVAAMEAVYRFLDITTHSGGTLEMLNLGGLAAIVAGLCLLIGQRLKWLLLPLAALGSMPLTSYSIHVIVIWIIAGPMGFVQDNLIFVSTVLLLTIACVAWAAWMGQGPLERLAATVGRRAVCARSTVSPAAPMPPVVLPATSATPSAPVE